MSTCSRTRRPDGRFLAMAVVRYDEIMKRDRLATVSLDSIGTNYAVVVVAFQSTLDPCLQAWLRAVLFSTAGGLFDQGGDGIGIGDIDGVATRHLGNGGTGPFRHELLRGIRD